VAITCGLIPAPEGTANEVFCAEPLLVGLRPEHRLAGRPAVALSDLAHDVLGTMPEDLFPAWSLSQRQALEAAGIDPPQLVPFTLQWNPDRAHTMAVARFVHATLTAEPPDGWRTLPDHLHHREEP
jgi:hypothetical protein